MMPLNVALPGEENIIRKIGGSPEVKQHLAVFLRKQSSLKKRIGFMIPNYMSKKERRREV